MSDIKNRLLLAIPKKGRLYDKAVDLLTKIELKYKRKSRLDIALCKNLPVAILFLPAKDIPLYVGEGEVDMGITGQDVVQETGLDVKELQKLNFGRCRLCLQAPQNQKLSLEDLVNKRIVTSFPKLTRKFFDQEFPGNQTKIRDVAGSVEVGCSLGLADGIVDLVESGDTMRAAGLEVVKEIMNTEAVLISNKNSPHDELIQVLNRRFEGVITAQKFAMIEYNILREKLAEGEKITPGRKSPTISPLEDERWVAVKSLIDKGEVNLLVDQLEKVGATDILVYGIDNCRV